MIGKILDKIGLAEVADFGRSVKTKGLSKTLQIARERKEDDKKAAPNDTVLEIHKIRSLREYQHFLSTHQVEYTEMAKVCGEYENNGKQEFTVAAYSYPMQKWERMHVDFLYSDGKTINWRERLICPDSLLNNRLRASIHMIDRELKPNVGSSIYIAEQLTPLYAYLSKKYKHLVGSEFLGIDVKSGTVNERGLRHEDATQLSFKDESFDYYLTFECLEHIPDYKKAFSEASRILKKGGKMFFTVPFRSGAHENLIRAVLNEKGEVVHLTEPEYHGDPVHSDKGILCFQHFGWQMFEELKEVGFTDSYALVFQSVEFGYFTEQMIFIACK